MNLSYIDEINKLKSDNAELECENSKLKALNAGFSDTLEKLSVWYDKVRAERDSLLKRIEFREEYLQFSAENERSK